MWLVFVFGPHCCSYSGEGGGVALVNLQVALVFDYGKGSCHFCNFNHCIRTRLLVFLSSNVRVGVAEFYLQIFVGMLVSWIGDSR